MKVSELPQWRQMGEAAGKRLGLGGRLRRHDLRDLRDHLSDSRDGDGAAFAEEAVMADFHEAGWEHVLQEAADEFEGIDGSGSQPTAFGFAVAEGDLVVFGVEDAVV